MLKFGQKSRSSLVLALVVLFCLFLTLPVLAEGGSGDGSGGGKDIPLGLASSDPADGASNVTVDTQIKLTFNKNVINMSVKDNNVKCFALYNNGQQVPISVIMADDQIQPEYKREVTIAPQQSLQPGSSYTLKISPELQAKNGTVLGQEIKVSFITAGRKDVTPTTPKNDSGNTIKPSEPVKQQTATDKNQAVQNQVTADNRADTNKLETSDNQVSADKDNNTKPDQDKVNDVEKSSSDVSKTQTANNDNGISKPLIAGIVVVAGALILYFLLRRK